MTACSECDVVVAQRDHLVLYAFAVSFSFLRESEAVERVCTRIEMLNPFLVNTFYDNSWRMEIRTSSKCAECVATETNVPAGTVVPSEKVKSFIAFRATFTLERR